MEQPQFRAKVKGADKLVSVDSIDWISRAISYNNGTMEVDADFEDVEELMQSIGLKDKTGREIFEGDILNDGTYVVFHMTQFGRASMWSMGFSPFIWRWVDSTTDSGGIVSSKDNSEDLIIIGNVWENPELFEGTLKKRGYEPRSLKI